MSLALEASRDTIMSERLFAKADFCQTKVAHHQIASDQRHFDGNLPILIFLGPAALLFRRVDILPLLAVGFHPGKSFFEFHGVVNLLIDAAQKLGHIDRFDTHPQVGLEETLVHDRTGNPHRYTPHRNITFSSHSGHR